MLSSDGLESWKACDEPIKEVGCRARIWLFCGYGPGCPLLASPSSMEITLCPCTRSAHFRPFCSCCLDCSSCNFV